MNLARTQSAISRWASSSEQTLEMSESYVSRHIPSLPLVAATIAAHTCTELGMARVQPRRSGRGILSSSGMLRLLPGPYAATLEAAFFREADAVVLAE